MRPIQPAGGTFNPKTKFFTKIGPILRPLRAPHFVSFLLFYCLCRRLLIPSALRLLSGLQIIRMLPHCEHWFQSSALQQIALDVHRLCLISAISVDMQWIPRDLNVLADDISKLVDRDDYTINDSVFFAMDTRAIDLPVITTRSSLYSTPGTISLGHLVSTPLLRIGPATTTGSALLSVWPVVLSTICRFATLLVLWSFLFGNRLTFGLDYVPMGCTGVVSSMTGLRFPIFQTCSSEAKLRIQFSVVVRSHSRWPLCVFILAFHKGKVQRLFATLFVFL